MKKMKQKLNRYSFLFFIFFLACTPKKLHIDEYMKYIEHNKDLIVSYEIDDVKYTCIYIPADYYYLLNRNITDSISDINNDKNLYFFKFIIESKSKDFVNFIRNNRDYFAFQIENSFSLNIDNNNIMNSPTIFHYENSFGLAPKATFLIAFFRKDIKNYFSLTFNFKNDLLNRNLYFEFPSHILKKIPTVIY